MWWWLSMALAAAPPGVDLDATAAWTEAADLLLDGPAGCWEAVGVATWNHDYKRFASTRGDAAFAGRLEDGVWSAFHVESLGEVARQGREPERLVYRDQPSFVPLIGRMSEGLSAKAEADDGSAVAVRSESEEPTNVLRGILDELSGETSLSYVEWDDQAREVVLHQVNTIGDGARAPEVEVIVHFPEGRLLPTRAEVIFPEAFPVNAFPRVSIRGARVQLFGQVHDGAVFPAAEVWHFDLRVLAMGFSSSQTLRYRQMARCATGG